MYTQEVTVNNEVGLHARPATYFIQKLFNAYWCGPPSGVTRTSSWTCVDHLVSRLPPPTNNALFRLALTAAAPLMGLSLAGDGNS